MKSMMTKSFNKLFFLISLVVLMGLTVGSIDTTEGASKVKQEDAPTAIATTCSALIESCARQPTLCGIDDTPTSTLLIDLYSEAVEDILALNIEPDPDDIALARGIIKAALITSVARQPEFQEDLMELEALCNQDIDAL